MASVQPYGSGWSVRYRYETDTGEKKMKRVSGFRTKEEAWSAAADLEKKSSAGIDVNGDSATCSELMETWFADHCAHLAATTRAKYSDSMDKLGETFISDMKIRRLDGKKFSLLLDQLMQSVSVRTAISNTEPLRFSLSWAVSRGLIPLNPLADVILPRVPKRPQRILSESDIEDLVSAASSARRRCSEFRIPLLLALYGGLRREECAGLRWDSVDFSLARITISEAITMTSDGEHHAKDPKTFLSSRTVSMPAWVMAELKVEYNRFLSRSDEYNLRHNPARRVCVTSTGSPYSCASYSHALRRLVLEINQSRDAQHKPRMPEISFHDLRHTHAAMLIRRNVQPKVISERLGHSSIKITMDTYGYLMPGLQDSVAELFNAEAEAAAASVSASAG